MQIAHDLVAEWDDASDSKIALAEKAAEFGYQSALGEQVESEFHHIRRVV